MDWETAVRDQRRQKEQFFAEDPRSPVADADDFAGLAFYDPDPEFRFELSLHEHDDPEPVVVETTADGQQEYLRWGEFRFEVDGRSCTLQAYRRDSKEESYWLPFRDETSGEETYGAGRYLDLDGEDRSGDRWVVDFNLAYNPTCAYNAAYECPLVPTENWLEVPIRAGERDYPGDPVDPHGHGHGHDH